VTAGIERIALRYFRGATRPVELAFDGDGSLLLIYGENGAGKSTLVDAIDLVCNRSAGSVADRPSASARQHLATLGHTPGELAVELTCGGQTWSGVWEGRGIVVDGPGPPPVAYVLRRRQLLRLIEALPAERYKELQRFIDVSGVERAEEALKDAARGAQARFEAANRRQEAALAALAELWEAEGRPDEVGGSALAWARERAEADLEVTRQLARDLDWLGGCIDAAAAAREAFHAARDEAAQRAAARDRLAAAGEQDGVGEAGAVLAMLHQVEAVLDAGDPAGCPVCRQEIDLPRLRAEVGRRIAALAETEAAARALGAAQTAATAAAAIAARARDQFLQAGRTLATEARASTLEGVIRMGIPWDEYPLLPGAASEAALAQAESLLERFTRVREGIRKRRARAEADLGQYHAVRQHWERVTTAADAIAADRHLHGRLARAHQLVRAQRVAFTQALLDRVAAECNRRYRALHPDEPLGLSGFRLDANRRASLLQEAYFLGEADLSPQAYFSESHLDTLGFVLFLTLARLYSGGDAILVLDDVFTSVDAAHTDRLLDLLAAESRCFRQVVVTTHSRSWWEGALAHPALAPGAEPVQLLPWSPDTGIRRAGRPGDHPAAGPTRRPDE
jgi:energy-coupling factor transporter ATP-binding protein EcfA2